MYNNTSFLSKNKTKQDKQNNNNNKKKKTQQIFLLDNYLMGYLFCFDWGCCQHAIY